MCEHVQNSQQGSIEDAYWKKIVNKMYDRDDVQTLTARFQDCIAARKQQSGIPTNPSVL
jgi:PBP1b-binding outer membrane lipoprotein LpoB